MLIRDKANEALCSFAIERTRLDARSHAHSRYSERGLMIARIRVSKTRFIARSRYMRAKRDSLLARCKSERSEIYCSLAIRANTKSQNETMIHIKGDRVHHELSRTYYWPKMSSQIIGICSAFPTSQEGQICR